MRLQAYLARAGAAPSRRKAEALIISGRVAVNGSVADLGAKVSPGDRVFLDGRPVRPQRSQVYLALNKPEGYLTTMKDDFGRPTVSDLMPKGVPGLIPVGRLDAGTTGLILLTNDGDFANLVAHPSSEVEKEYRLLIDPQFPDGALEALARGPDLDDGPMLPPQTTRPRRKGRNLEISMTIHEGKNRIIRRACAAVGLRLVSLSRVRVGGVSLAGLAPGAIRELSGEEVGGFYGRGSGGGRGDDR
ncbi:pseudouridine synthase [Rubrobacter indicoceani]|uniref:pseudouridine synthase n=1 Tax=Rubrobacter indicoceani TaxID=2051957 RepID=UPI000E5B67F6|nr:pseudouridine synthase [Rubrobacter indicoceani]